MFNCGYPFCRYPSVWSLGSVSRTYLGLLSERSRSVRRSRCEVPRLGLSKIVPTFVCHYCRPRPAEKNGTFAGRKASSGLEHARKRTKIEAFEVETAPSDQGVSADAYLRALTRWAAAARRQGGAAGVPGRKTGEIRRIQAWKPRLLTPKIATIRGFLEKVLSA